MSSKDLKGWDTEISASHSLFDLRLRDIWRYKDLLLMFVFRDFRAFYKQTILGPIWFFIQPIFTMTMYLFVFGSLAGLSTDGVPQPLFYLAGIMVWSYFSECLNKTATVFRSGAGIFGKVYFPRIIMPLSIVVSSLLRFFIQLVLFLIVYLVFWIKGDSPSPTLFLFLFPFLIFLLAIQGLSLGMIVSSLTTKYRDLALLLSFGVQLLMYATTVVYPLSSLEGRMKFLVSLNPVTYVLEGVRKGFLGAGTFDTYALVYLVGVTVFLFFFGLITFNKVERNFIDTI